MASHAKQVVGTGTPWEARCGCARAVRVGDQLHISGTCAQGDTVTAQTQAIFTVMDNAIRKAGGRGLQDIVITRMIAANVQADFQELGDAHNAIFAPLNTTPANTLFGGTLLLPWMKVEIEATAVLQPTAGKKVVLVTGATGRIGKEVVARLAKTGGWHVRAAMHNPAKAGYLKDLGADELIEFDYTNPETWKAACKDAEVIYSASLDPLLEHHLKFCEYLGTIKSQIKQVVRISCMGADTNTACYNKAKHVTREGAEIPLMLQHYWWGEEALIKAGLAVTVLRNNFFMNHLLKTDCEQIDKEGFFANPLGSMRNSFVCTNDIAEAAVVCMNEGPARHANKFYDLTGPEPQSMFEIAADLAAVLKKPVEYRPQSMVQFEADFGPTRAGFFEYLCNGFYARCSPDFYNLTGRRPTTYAEYLTTKGAAGETGLEELYQANLWKKGQDAMKEAAGAVKVPAGGYPK